MKLCRWCREPTPISPQSTTGLCREHWLEYNYFITRINSMCGCGRLKSRASAKMCGECMAKKYAKGTRRAPKSARCDCGRWIRKHGETECSRCRRGLN